MGLLHWSSPPMAYAVVRPVSHVRAVNGESAVRRTGIVVAQGVIAATNASPHSVCAGVQDISRAHRVDTVAVNQGKSPILRLGNDRLILYSLKCAN
jgi:hypothetical protein